MSVFGNLNRSALIFHYHLLLIVFTSLASSVSSLACVAANTQCVVLHWQQLHQLLNWLFPENTESLVCCSRSFWYKQTSMDCFTTRCLVCLSKWLKRNGNLLHASVMPNVEDRRRTRNWEKRKNMRNAQQFHHWLGIQLAHCFLLCDGRFPYGLSTFMLEITFVLQFIACFLIILFQLRNEWISATHKINQITIAFVQIISNFCNSLNNWNHCLRVPACLSSFPNTFVYHNEYFTFHTSNQTQQIYPDTHGQRALKLFVAQPNFL